MKTVEASKFLGVKVWVDDENFNIIKGVIRNYEEERKRKLLEFKNEAEIDKFIKWLKQKKKVLKEMTSH